MSRSAVTISVCLGLAGSILTSAWCQARGEGVRLQRTEAQVTLDNGLCRLVMDAGTGEIASLAPGPASLCGSWLEVVEEDRAGLQPWETWKIGPEATFRGGPGRVQGEATGGNGIVRVTWARPNGLRVEGEFLLRTGDPGPLVRVTVYNATGAALVDTVRILLRGIQLNDPEDDWFTWPHTLGCRYRVRGLAPGQILEQGYPGFLTMQWLDLFDAEQGVYLGCLDDYGYSKTLQIGRDAEGRSVMGVSFVGCWVATRGDAWTTPWVQIAGHQGDWRRGADLYRPFAETAFGPLDPPERVRDMPTAQCWLAHHADDGDVARLFEVQQQAPIHASYLMKSLNTSVPEGWDGFRGSALEFQDTFARIRELGGSPALFTFDRAPLMGRPNYANHVGDWTCRRRDGSFYEGFRDMMPAPFDPDYIRARVGEAVRWVQAFGLDEIHFDTAATADGGLAGPDYRPGSGHRPNQTPHGFKVLYRAIRDACREHNPDFLLRAEHCADFFFPEFLTSTVHYMEGVNQLMGHNPPADAQAMPMLFKYTLPRHTCFLMPSTSENDFWTYGCGMGHGFHGGGPSWCFNPGVREAESPPGELLHRYRFYDAEWRRYYDFRVGFEEAVVDAEWADSRAQVLLDGQWVSCDYPGPVVAVTHGCADREVTLGQWYPLSRTGLFAERLLPKERSQPRPVRLRVPTRLAHSRVRLFGEEKEVPVEATVADGVVELEVADPTCFALEVSIGPSVTLELPELARPGETVEVGVRVEQSEPEALQVAVQVPPGWGSVAPVAVPSEPTFRTTVALRVPEGIFGRNYPLKAVLTGPGLKRTTAAHLKVMEPLTVLYGFDAVGETGPLGLNCVDPARPARLTVTCVNNTPEAAEVAVQVRGEGLAGDVSARLEGVSPRDLGRADSPLGLWTEGRGAVPANALVCGFDYQCLGVPATPVRIRVTMNGATAFQKAVYPRTRLMDLNGEWRVGFMRASRAQVGGAERNDNLDTEAVTPDVWDGGWQAMATPIHLDSQTRADNSWAVYRRLVRIPAEWQGAELWLRLGNTGAPWGHGGTLNIIYVNGWPAGRVGWTGECTISPFVVWGGWNLLAVASHWPNSLVEPYLFVRDVPDPARVRPAQATARPAGAFLELGRRPTGQGMGMVFVQGVVEGDHRRTDVAQGGEWMYIYLTVSDQFLKEPDGPVEIEVEYLDRGTAPFSLDYDSADPTAPVNGAFKRAEPCQRTDTGQWLTHTFMLPDPRLANRQHLGADFRLVAMGGEDLHVRRVAIRRSEP